MNKLYFYFSATLFFVLTSIGLLTAQNRTISGINNNLTHPEWGAIGTNQLQLTPIAFGDGISTPAGIDRQNPRVISNMIFHQDGLLPDALELSDYAWLWGQFIDHDVTLSPNDPSQPFDITVPTGDIYFDPNGTGTVLIKNDRSAYDPSSGTDISNPRAFPNEITAFIDASNVYGSDQERADWLRTFEDGKLKTSVGNMLPYNTLNGELDADIDIDAPAMAMANPFAEKWFVAGDERANENLLLTSMHTIFLREHNRLCDEIAISYPQWTDELIYQKARKKVGAILQAIVYEEWLPSLGVQLGTYPGYQDDLNPGIMNIFSSAAYRYGHTVINSTIVRLDENGNTIPEGNIQLKDAFFNPQELIDGGGVNPLLRGMATQIEQDFDAKMISDLRNFLFGPPGAGGLDLASLNIQRGRDRGLADYNSVREYFGMTHLESFDELTSDPYLNTLMENVFVDIDNVDPWVGFLTEDHMSNTLFGQTVMKIMEEQFRALRDGDRFFYENDGGLTTVEKEVIKGTRLSEVIMRNTEVNNLQNNVFLATPMTTLAAGDLDEEEIMMSIYPNPSSGNYFVNTFVEKTEEGVVQVYDLLGKTVLSEKRNFIAGMNNFEFSLNDMSTGRYILRLTFDSGSGVQQIVKL